MSKHCNQLLCVCLALAFFFLSCESAGAAQVDIASMQNVTIDDSNISMVLYAPSTSWRASTVPCSACLNPPSSDASGGTWHDGTHIVKSSDSDDFGPNGGDTNGTSSAGTSSASSAGAIQSHSSSPASISTPPPASPPSSSTSSTAASPSPSKDGDDDDGDNGDDGDSGKQKGKGDKDKMRRDVRQNASEENSSNPFFTTGEDSDDPGFVDPAVTATINFTGTAIYLFAIIPNFAALPQTDPTAMNLTFTLDGKPHGQFRNNPTSLNSSSSDNFIPNFAVFSAEGLLDGEHSIVVTVGPDSVFLFDYALVTQNASSTDGSNAPQRTSSPDSSDP
ncbi:hypothetical protein SCHPADRAFT_937806 [Schizopora paradoxa]|uniref:Uncharacterized protein n=1 Tax=Schizopora paradoxa TaxID=27342 RepID=A0A0H2SHR3_9AGAM|nr:hypothetical protein SCHPADRAFT_937806 [Schizopora paradoxa]